MTAETPITSHVMKHGFFNDYEKHVQMLKIDAKGAVLIIGPGLEEMAVIEPAISRGKVTSVTLIGENPIFLEPVLTICRRNYEVTLQADALSFGAFFDSNPSLTFDTILYIGRSGDQHLNDLLCELAMHLNPSGNAYLTINSPHIPTTLSIPECLLKIIPEIAPNSNYRMLPDYYGVVLNKI